MKMKRLTSWLLAAALVFALIPSAAIPSRAEVEPEPEQGVPYIDRWWDETTKSVKEAQKTSKKYTIVESSDAAEGPTWLIGWYVVTENVEISGRITVSGSVSLILCDGAKLTADKGITVTEGNSLTIYAQSEGENMGALVANGVDDAAGIGGGTGGVIS